MFRYLNLSHLSHTIVAVAIQSLFGGVGVLFGAGPWGFVAGGLFATGIFLGREHAQREYKIGDPSKLWGHEALLDFPNWSIDAKLDLICPVVAVTLGSLLHIWLRLPAVADAPL